MLKLTSEELDASVHLPNDMRKPMRELTADDARAVAAWKKGDPETANAYLWLAGMIEGYRDAGHAWRHGVFGPTGEVIRGAFGQNAPDWDDAA